MAHDGAMYAGPASERSAIIWGDLCTSETTPMTRTPVCKEPEPNYEIHCALRCVMEMSRWKNRRCDMRWRYQDVETDFYRQRGPLWAGGARAGARYTVCLPAACLPSCLSVCLSACCLPAACLPACLIVCLSVCLLACCLPACLPAFMPVCLSVCFACLFCLSVYLSICLSVLSVCLSACLFVRLPACLFIYPAVCIYVLFSVSPPIHLSTCLCVYLIGTHY